MSFRILPTIDTAALDTACIIVPCFSAEDAQKALKTLQISAPADRFVREFNAACEDPATTYLGDLKLIFVGLAKSRTYGKIRHAFQVLSGKLRSKSYKSHILLLSHLQQSAEEMALLADGAVNGLLMGRYQFGLLKSQNGDMQEKEKAGLDVITGTFTLGDAIRVGQEAAGAQKEICDLVNLPSSHKTPESLAEWARQSGKAHHYEVDILDENALEAQGFKALLAVNRGSEYPARLIVTRFNGTEDPSTPLIALVGKGVTFDTGGVSLKHGDAVHLMKSDMGGAGAALGAVELLARMNAPVRVIGCAPCTDNNIGTRSINPGDVIGSYSGKTIEVINTDAEGRLILADALNYIIRKYQPDAVVDLATLTGSMIRALGSYCAGVFTHSDALANALIAAGEASGERLWRMPLWEEYGDEMKSEIADVKNLSDKPAAGAITAAKFIEFFVENHPAWAHMDIAGTAYKTNGVSKGHAATAYGVRMLYEFVTHYRK